MNLSQADVSRPFTVSAWLTPEALVDFIDDLRQVGFRIGLDEYIAAQDLLVMLAANGADLSDPQRMASLLGPLLCSSPAEQESFPQHFLRWAERRRAELGEQAARPSLEEALSRVEKRSLRWQWILFSAGILFLLFAAGFWFLRGESANGSFIPASFIPSNLTIPAIQNQEAVIPFVGVIVSVFAVLALIWLAWLGWWWLRARQFLSRRATDQLPDVRQVSVNTSRAGLFDSLQFLALARAFRKRVAVESVDLDVMGTVEATIAQGGWFTPAYGQRRLPPEYLVLVDRRGNKDHFARFVEAMVDHMRENGVYISTYAYDGDPRLCFPLQGKGRPLNLMELAAQQENLRLIVFGEGDGLINPISGRLADWTRLFHRWTERALFTPQRFGNWGSQEEELSRVFNVLPANQEGLSAFIRILQGLEKIGPGFAFSPKGAQDNAGEPSAPIPAVLQERPQVWIARSAPPDQQVEQVLADLRAYLGEAGYDWLAACAVYPELHWNVTLTLGQSLKDATGNPYLNPRRLVDLARLPWFRYGSLPDWLRVRLISELSPAQQREVRGVLEAMLVTAVYGDDQTGLEVARRKRFLTGWLARPLLALLRREAAPESPLKDHVFLDFMFHRLNLAVRAPQVLRRQLTARAGDQAAWQVLVKWVGGHLVVAFLWFLLMQNFLSDPAILINLVNPYPQIYQSDSSYQIFSIILILIHMLILGTAVGFLQWLLLRRFWPLNPWLWILSGTVSFCYLAVLNVLCTASILTSSLNYNFLPFGLSNLTMMGFLQALQLAQKRVSPAQRWLFASTLPGMFVAPLLFYFPDETSPMHGYGIYFFVAVLALYTIFTGAALVTMLSRNDRHAPANTRKAIFQAPSFRLDWLMVNGISFSVGVGFGQLVMSNLFPNVSDSAVASSLVGSVALLVVGLAQWLLLRSYGFVYAGLWAFLTALAFEAVFLLAAKLGLAVSFGNVDSGLVGLGLGIASGLVQAWVWRKIGLQPVHMLIWFLLSALGWYLTFAAFVFYPSNIRDYPVEVNLFGLIVISAPFGLLTILPFGSFMREALRRQSDLKDPSALTVVNYQMGRKINLVIQPVKHTMVYTITVGQSKIVYSLNWLNKTSSYQIDGLTERKTSAMSTRLENAVKLLFSPGILGLAVMAILTFVGKFILNRYREE